jgi:predicted DNA-binding WGR domain protein
VFLMNRFWNLEELEADAGGPTLMQQWGRALEGTKKLMRSEIPR